MSPQCESVKLFDDDYFGAQDVVFTSSQTNLINDLDDDVIKIFVVAKSREYNMYGVFTRCSALGTHMHTYVHAYVHTHTSTDCA